jgi:hypothetical protein
MRYETVDGEDARALCCVVRMGSQRCRHFARYVRMRHDPYHGWVASDAFCAAHAPTYVDVKNALRMER